MNKKNKIRVCLLTGFVVILCLICIGCGADEEALFMEAESMTEEASAMETGSITAGASVVKDAGVAGEDSTMESGSVAEENSVAESGNVLREEPEECIVVHVCGAVLLPGVYELDAGSRVMDAVLAAGGFSQEADTEYVNLATVLADGNKVKIPTKEETTVLSQGESAVNDSGVTSAQSQQNTEETVLAKVNINTADKELLCTLPGIGETRAESILAYRSEHGSFSKIEDIMLVSGIKESSFQKIKEYISIK